MCSYLCEFYLDNLIIYSHVCFTLKMYHLKAAFLRVIFIILDVLLVGLQLPIQKANLIFTIIVIQVKQVQIVVIN